MCSLAKEPVAGAGLERRQVGVPGRLVPRVDLTSVLAFLASALSLASSGLTTSTTSILTASSSLTTTLTTTALTSSASALPLSRRHLRILNEGFV